MRLRRSCAASAAHTSIGPDTTPPPHTHTQLLHLHLNIIIWKQEIKKSFLKEFPSKHSIIMVKREPENKWKWRTGV